MNEPHEPEQTIDIRSVPDSLDAGLAAGFSPPRSSLGDMRPPLLKEAEGESVHVVKPKSDAMPPPEQAGDLEVRQITSFAAETFRRGLKRDYPRSRGER